MVNKEKKTGRLTTVKTVYARAVLLLLAVNFCLTTYVVLNLNKSIQEQITGSVASSLNKTAPVSSGVVSEGTAVQEITTETP
jgi:hypothetical protein